MLTYLAAPYSHKKPEVMAIREALIAAATSFLSKDGHTIYSPITHSSRIAVAGRIESSWDKWKYHDLDVLARCDQLLVLTLPGWDLSTGVGAEIEYAEELKIPVAYEDMHDILAFNGVHAKEVL